MAIRRDDSNSNEEIPFAEEFIAKHLDRVLEVAVSFCSDAQMLNRLKPYRFGFDYSNFLIFIGKIEEAKLAYLENHTKLKDKIEKKEFSEREYESDCQIVLKNFVKYGKDILGLELSIAYKPKNVSVKIGGKFCIHNELNFEEAYSIVKSPNGIFDYYVNMNGETIISHANDDLITIWSKEGVMLIECRVEQSTDKIVGYIEDCDVFFVNNFLITRTLEVKQLKPPLIIVNRKEVVVSNYRCTKPVYFRDEKQWVILYSFYHKKNTNIAHFYDENFNLTKTVPLDNDFLDIIPTTKWILTCKRSTYFHINDFDGNLIVELESNNAASGHYYLDYHCFTKSFSHLFSFSYYVKSQLFNLSDFSMKALWAHTTYEKDYKELLYNDINHNFGVTKASFSPDDTYLVAGACHGKYVAWNLPGYERIELIPNAEYLAKMPNAEVVFIGKNRYLKNRNHQMGNIQFWENGKYFSFQINQDTLIFNRQFEHIQTIENSGSIKCFGQFATSFKDSTLTFYH